MDPLTAFVIAILMMLLNGAVLGMIHRDLPEVLRPAAFSWRVGTLLIAAGCVAHPGAPAGPASAPPRAIQR